MQLDIRGLDELAPQKRNEVRERIAEHARNAHLPYRADQWTQEAIHRAIHEAMLELEIAGTYADIYEIKQLIKEMGREDR